MPLTIARRRGVVVGLGVIVVVLLGLVILLTFAVSTSSTSRVERQLMFVSGSGDQRSGTFDVTAPTAATLSWASRSALQISIVRSDGTPVEPTVSCVRACSGTRVVKLTPADYHVDVQGTVVFVAVGAPI
jgi:hypothetical protein